MTTLKQANTSLMDKDYLKDRVNIKVFEYLANKVPLVASNVQDIEKSEVVSIRNSHEKLSVKENIFNLEVQNFFWDIRFSKCLNDFLLTKEI
jgi:hypothetical protein